MPGARLRVVHLHAEPELQRYRQLRRRGTDNGSPGLSATATFSVTVAPINDAPVANDQSVDVPEDSVNFPITLTATDVDNVTLTFTCLVDDVDHGTVNCIGECVHIHADA